MIFVVTCKYRRAKITCTTSYSVHIYGHTYSSNIRSLIWPTESSTIGIQWNQNIRIKYCSVVGLSLHWFFSHLLAMRFWCCRDVMVSRCLPNYPHRRYSQLFVVSIYCISLLLAMEWSLPQFDVINFVNELKKCHNGRVKINNNFKVRN